MTDTPATSKLTEIARVRDTYAQSAATAFNLGWLFPYPRPVIEIHDQGTEFMRENFQAIL